MRGCVEVGVYIYVFYVCYFFISEFDDYFLGLSLDHSNVDPWFGEYWESMFDCTFTDTRNRTKCTGMYLRLWKVLGLKLILFEGSRNSLV